MNENEKKYVEETLKKYTTQKTSSKLDELKALDKKAKRKAHIFAYVFGTIGTLILGFGMCVAMKVILPQLMWLGIVVGVVGILMISLNYVIFKNIWKKDKEKYANQIKNLSQELLHE